jgi:DNA-binding MarR family transcriptional regulator
MAAFFSLHRVLSEEMDRQLRATCGLSTAQVDVLLLLATAPSGRLRMADVADRVRVSKSGVTQIVDRLVATGQVDRETSATDRRLVYASITDAGRQTVDKVIPVFTTVAHAHLSSRLTMPETRDLRTALEKILEGGRDEPAEQPAGR